MGKMGENGENTDLSNCNASKNKERRKRVPPDEINVVNLDYHPNKTVEKSVDSGIKLTEEVKTSELHISSSSGNEGNILGIQNEAVRNSFADATVAFTDVNNTQNCVDGFGKSSDVEPPSDIYAEPVGDIFLDSKDKNFDINHENITDTIPCPQLDNNFDAVKQRHSSNESSGTFHEKFNDNGLTTATDEIVDNIATEIIEQCPDTVIKKSNSDTINDQQVNSNRETLNGDNLITATDEIVDNIATEIIEQCPDTVIKKSNSDTINDQQVNSNRETLNGDNLITATDEIVDNIATEIIEQCPDTVIKKSNSDTINVQQVNSNRETLNGDNLITATDEIVDNIATEIIEQCPDTVIKKSNSDTINVQQVNSNRETLNGDNLITATDEIVDNIATEIIEQCPDTVIKKSNSDTINDQQVNSNRETLNGDNLITATDEIVDNTATEIIEQCPDTVVKKSNSDTINNQQVDNDDTICNCGAVINSSDEHTCDESFTNSNQQCDDERKNNFSTEKKCCSGVLPASVEISSNKDSTFTKPMKAGKRTENLYTVSNAISTAPSEHPTPTSARKNTMESSHAGLHTSESSDSVEHRRRQWLVAKGTRSLRNAVHNRPIDTVSPVHHQRPSRSAKLNSNAPAPVPLSHEQLLSGVTAGTTLENLTTVQLENLPGASGHESATGWSLAELAVCTNLRVLVVRNCHLRECNSISACRRLEYVDLSFNQLCCVSLKGCSRLHRLLLRQNTLQRIPDLEACAALKWLDVSHNKIARLKFELQSCLHLQHLNLGHNEIVTCEGLSHTPLLQHLVIRANYLIQIEELDWLCLLRYLDLSGNNLRKCPNLVNNPLLSHLNISNNPNIPCLADLENFWLPSLHTLLANNTALSEFSETTIMALPCLRRLEVHDNPGCLVSPRLDTIVRPDSNLAERCRTFCADCTRRRNKLHRRLTDTATVLDPEMQARLWRRYLTDRESEAVVHRQLLEADDVAVFLKNHKHMDRQQPVTLLLEEAPDIKTEAVVEVDTEKEEKVDDEKLHQSARFIQAMWRGHRARKWMLAALEEALRAQSVLLDDGSDSVVDLSEFDVDVDAMFDDMNVPPAPKDAWQLGSAAPDLCFANDTLNLKPGTNSSSRAETICDMKDSSTHRSALAEVMSQRDVRRRERIVQDW